MIRFGWLLLVVGCSSPPDKQRPPASTTDSGTGCVDPDPTRAFCNAYLSDDQSGEARLQELTVYDACGRAESTVGYSDEGVPVRHTDFFYLPDGRLDSWQQDVLTLDGDPESVAQYFYDAQGRVDRIETDHPTDACTTTFTYVDADELYEEQAHSCVNAVASNYIERTTSDPTRPVEHRWTTRERDYEDELRIDELETVDYDAALNQTVSRVDYTGSAEGSATTTGWWRTDQQIEREEVDHGSTGVAETTIEYHYDAEDRPLGFDRTGLTAWSSWTEWVCAED